MNQPKLNTIIPHISVQPTLVRLDNGVELNAIPLMTTDLVTISIMFYGGQWAQEKRLQSDFTMNLLKSGTAHLTSEALTDRLDYYGATVVSGSTIAYTFVQLMCLRRNLAEALPLLCDIIASPMFEQRRMDNAIEEGILAYQMGEQKVAQVNKRIFYQQLLGERHPAAQYPKESDYRELTREDLVAYHQKCIRMDNAVVYVTGRTDEELLLLINQHLGHLECGEPSPFRYQQEEIVTSAQRMHEATLAVPAAQSGLRMGKVMPDSHSKDYPALQLTSTLLGGYFGSRLMKNIRERLGFTYGISSNFFCMPQKHVFFITTETPKEHVPRCIEEIKKDILDLQNHLVTDEEMRNARNYRLGQFCRATETSLSLNTLLIHQRAQGRDLQSMLKEQQAIQDLTPKDIMLCAQKYFATEDLLIVATHGKQPL